MIDLNKVHSREATVNVKEVLTLAYVAYRINGKYIKDTRRFSEDVPTVFSNKEIIKNFLYLQNKETAKGYNMYVPTDFVLPKITKEDTDNVVEGLKYMRRYVMLGLGELSDFQRDMVTYTSEENIPFSRIGLLAYFPQFVKNDIADTLYVKTLRKDYANSQWITNDVIEGEIEILKGFPLEQYNSNMYIGIHSGNIVNFMNKNKYKVGNKLLVKAKKSKCEHERITKFKSTRLNYVKVKKVLEC